MIPQETAPKQVQAGQILACMQQPTMAQRCSTLSQSLLPRPSKMQHALCPKGPEHLSPNVEALVQQS